MVATFNKQADIIVILLLFAFKHMSTDQLERGMWTRDFDNLTAAHIAVNIDSLECTSVLLYLHPKFANIVDDLSKFPIFFSTLNLSSCESKGILKIPGFYKNVTETGKSTANILFQSGRPSINYSNGIGRVEQLFHSIVKSSAEISIKNIEEIPRMLIFLSLRITFFYSVCIFIATFSMASFKCAVLFLQILGISSIYFMWLLYSKLCNSNPGFVPMNDTSETYNHQISEIFRSEVDICGAVEDYNFALNLLYRSSNIVGTSNLKEKKIAFYELCSRRYCCHYCRIFQPLRSRHCKTLDRCVPNYDHYCIFLRNHIGRDNYPYFIGSLVTATGSVLPLFLYNMYSYPIGIGLKTKLGYNSSFFLEVLHNSLIVKFMELIMVVDDSRDYTNFIRLEMNDINWFLEHFFNGFFKWCCIWWIIFSILLLFHIYLMSLNLTTRQFINISELGWLNVWKHTKNITKNSFSNVCEKLLLKENIICHIDNVEESSQASRPSGPVIVSKVFHACRNIFFERF